MARKKAEKTIKKANELNVAKNIKTRDVQENVFYSAEYYYQSSLDSFYTTLENNIEKAHNFIDNILTPAVLNASNRGLYSISIEIDEKIANLVTVELKTVYFYNVTLLSSLNSVYLISWEDIIVYEPSRQGDFQNHPVTLMSSKSYKFINTTLNEVVTSDQPSMSFNLEFYPSVAPSSYAVKCVIKRGTDEIICDPSAISYNSQIDVMTVTYNFLDGDEIVLTYPVYKVPLWSTPIWVNREPESNEDLQYFNKVRYNKGKVTVLYG